jgi:hypothetical protein
MNWYQKFIKVSNRNVLDVDSINISRKIFEDIRNSINNGLNNKHFSYSLNDIIRSNDIPEKEGELSEKQKALTEIDEINQ